MGYVKTSGRIQQHVLDAMPREFKGPPGATGGNILSVGRFNIVG
jgi:hypothetical protein